MNLINNVDYFKNCRKMHMLGYHFQEVLYLAKKCRDPGDRKCTDNILFLKLGDGYMGVPYIILDMLAYIIKFSLYIF